MSTPEGVTKTLAGIFKGDLEGTGRGKECPALPNV